MKIHIVALGDRLNTQINPWLTINANDYEEHMSDKSVLQLQELGNITRDQLNDYTPEKVLILGIATGNGLEFINNRITKYVFGIDINESYLELCYKRFSSTINNLKLFKIDLSKEVLLIENIDLIIANLILEYVHIDRIFDQINKIGHVNTIISIVIQMNHNTSFVSDTGIDTLKSLEEVHNDINVEDVKEYFLNKKYKSIKEIEYKLPNSKSFIRLDFIKQN